MSISISAPEPGLPPSEPAVRAAAFFGLDTLIPGSSLYLLAQGLQRRHFYGRADLLGFAWQRLVFRTAPRGSSPAPPPPDAAPSFVPRQHRPPPPAPAPEIAH